MDDSVFESLLDISTFDVPMDTAETGCEDLPKDFFLPSESTSGSISDESHDNLLQLPFSPSPPPLTATATSLVGPATVDPASTYYPGLENEAAHSVSTAIFGTDTRSRNACLYTPPHLLDPRSGPSTAGSTPQPLPTKRGRPKGIGKATKPVIYGPRRRRGRPPGTGHRQKEKERGMEGQGTSLAVKRPRGRPRKVLSPSSFAQPETLDLPRLSSEEGSIDRQASKQAWAVLLDGKSTSTSTSTPRVRTNSPAGLGFFTPAGISRLQRDSIAPRTPVPQPITPATSSAQTPSPLAPSPLASPPLIAELEHASATQDCVMSSGDGPSLAPSTAPHRTIIPEEDPQRCVEPQEDDVDPEDGADGAGLGEEDPDPDNDDELEDEHDWVDNSDVATPRPLSRRPLPQWLQDAFQTKLKEARQRDSNGLPPLYAKHQTFWYPQKSTFFLLSHQRASPATLYNPRFFLWDPHPLCRGIPCPNCRAPLQRHGEISRPRRCVDTDSTFWVIGYRYRCYSCIHPKSKKRTVTFRSWDHRILEVLPPALAAEFPARLSHRSGISCTLFGWMRSCLQNGFGTKQFADALRVQHLLAHDHLHIQYLEYLLMRKHSLDGWTSSEKYEAFLPFDDVTPRGRHGFVPSSQWIRDMYDGYIEAHRHDFNQHAAMLTAEIFALDHSHKVTKQLSTFDGEPAFTALMTLTNEKSQIRECNLVATKAQSQYEPALINMRQSLTLYGHNQPAAAYTDNISDKAFLERCFPSLRAGVVPIEKYADLEAINISHIEILRKDDATSINDAIRSILEDVPLDEGNLVVGFDAEWNVEVSSYGSLRRSDKIAIVQIAYQNRVYILQISKLIERGELPFKLKRLLSHPRILKVGRLVDSDLAYLQDACHSAEPFIGGLDLAKHAKARCLISNISKTSLSDLSALVLHRRLDKNVSERISQDWDRKDLSEDQIQYAAKDAYVSLRIYEELSRIPVPCPLPTSLSPSLPVLLYSTNNTSVIAVGQISQLFNNSAYDGINITSGRTIVEISRVLVPGAILTTHHNRPLNSFGAPPFSAVCLRSHLRLANPMIVESLSGSGNSLDVDTYVLGDTTSPQMSSANSLATGDEADTEQASIGDLLFQDLSGASNTSQLRNGTNIDPFSAALGAEILGEDPNSWDSVIHSRVLKDVWHVFHMFYISATHGLRKEFTRELRDAIFLPDSTDRARINAWGATQTPVRTYESLRNSSPQWLRRRCKHIIPPPDQLYPAVANVFRTFGPLVDPDTKKPLFTRDNWKTAKNILDLIKKGNLSDPPGVALYTVIGIDKKSGGLPMYRCARGTNTTEGGVHTHIRSRLPKFGVSIRHLQASLMDFVLHHNLLTGTYNSTGQHYRGHFSIWLTNRLQELLISLQDVLIDPVHITGWVNTNLYVPTSEVLGILPIPDDIRAENALAPYDPLLHSQQKHHFLAEMQGTRKPVLPVHTAAEKQLFRKLMNENTVFSPPSGEPQWKAAARVWNEKAEQMTDVSYKLTEQLKTYYAKWKERSHVTDTLSLSAGARKSLTDVIHNPRRLAGVPPVPDQPLQPISVPRGLLALNPSAHTSQPNVFSSVSGPAFINQPQPFIPHTVELPPHPNTFQTPSNRFQTELLARQRVATMIANTQPPDRPRKRRTCQKCGIEGCPGSQKVSNCKNPCRDCGLTICRGRNSKRPDKPCWLAWIC